MQLPWWIKYPLIGVVGSIIGMLSPWHVSEWQYWALIAPCCFSAGVLMGIYL